MSLAYYNKRDDKQKRGLETLEKAYALDEHDSRILMELDQLYKRLGADLSERLAFWKHICLKWNSVMIFPLNVSLCIINRAAILKQKN